MPYLGLLIMALWLFSLIDAITADEGGIRHLPKAVWVIAVLLVPLVGSLAWLFLGRPVGGPVWGSSTVGARPSPNRSGGARSSGVPPLPSNPETDAEFQRQFRARAEEQRRIGRELRKSTEE